MKCIKPQGLKGGQLDESSAACCPAYYINPDEHNCKEHLCPPEGWDYLKKNPGIIDGNMACSVCKETPENCFDTTQAMWTDHCLQKHLGGDSDFPPKLKKYESDIVLQKGTNQYVDAYSAFYDNTQSYKTDLEAILKASQVQTLYVVGIATDFCVLETVRDAIVRVPSIKDVVVITDATASVQGDKNNFDAAVDEMRELGATVVTSADVLEAPCTGPVVPASTAVKKKKKNKVCGGKSALLVIDVQDCFLESATSSGKPGTLAVPASHVIPLVNSLRDQKSCLFDKVIFSQDHHTSNHISFASTHGLPPFAHLSGKGGLPMRCVHSSTEESAACCPTAFVDPSKVDCDKELCPPKGWNYNKKNPDIIKTNKACKICKKHPEQCFETEQSMWPDHCIQEHITVDKRTGEKGDSGFPPTLKILEDDIVVQKGNTQFVDHYSAFMDITQSYKTDLEKTLVDNCIDTIYVAGIATDVCVYETVRDALIHIPGIKNVHVIQDATAAVLGNVTNFESAVGNMRALGANIVSVKDLLKKKCPSKK